MLHDEWFGAGVEVVSGNHFLDRAGALQHTTFSAGMHLKLNNKSTLKRKM